MAKLKEKGSYIGFRFKSLQKKAHLDNPSNKKKGFEFLKIIHFFTPHDILMLIHPE
ncbi:hypothetical protein GQR60_03620 [Labilibaculum sp. A4]|nr:hypothetical protein [Labilibaculum euxinus]